ncbi:mitogen-activated protein kinase kinase kinase 18-like [Mangifera indica]|uniref:mitogen-activated protein kinase kinase kinase 18-like n=1 Tax=Mangifera indica TaxID=29780 RepID=UPI001CF9D5F6|nr:mitogen-activated protein kinase kinase kinase 18-like [Mangifera indica]
MEWKRGPVIGRGSTATVSLATVVPSGELIAVKSTEISKSEFLQREQNFLSKMNSPYIVKYRGFNVTEEMYNLCMEFAPGGSLHDEIQRRGGRLNEQRIKFYTSQILKGLDYLHMNGLVHCDIKSKNILIGKDGFAKISDLGCAKFVDKFDDDESFAASEFSGTPAFMAPEVARREEQGFAADIWAVGCTIIEMATGTNPWPELSDPVSALYRIGFSGEVPETPRWLSVEAKEFLSKCLRKDPIERWTAKELLQHPFVSEAIETRDCFIEEANMSSPCTVLDHGIWDSAVCRESSTQKVCSLNSAGERIQKLFGIAADWSWDDEDWTTVRANDEDHNVQGTNELPAAATIGFDLVSAEGVQSSIFYEDLLLESSVESATFTDDFVLENVWSETDDNEDSFLNQSQFMPMLYFSLLVSFQIAIFCFHFCFFSIAMTSLNFDHSQNAYMFKLHVNVCIYFSKVI